MLRWFKEFFSGFTVGAANIIPGISGGTVLFLLGFYERTMAAVNNFKPANIKTVLRCAQKSVFGNQRKEHQKQLICHMRALDALFLIRLLAGAGLAILLLSGVMKFLLETYFTNTYAFFFGLMTMSTVMALKMLKVWKRLYLIHLIAGIAVMLLVTVSIDPSVNAKIKSDNYKSRLAAELVAANEITCPNNAPDGAAFKYFRQYTGRDFAAIGFTGVVAICAMAMPGLSGSLVMILMGQYHEVISAISGLKSLQLDYFVFLMIMAIGMGAGILIFARVISFVFKRFYDGTVALMIGLTAGSLYALWPFKGTVVIDQYIKHAGQITLVENAVIQTNKNILPADAASALSALLFCAAGAGIVAAMDRYSRKL
ncbi:MAG: DUF368 domain-containing protein [Chitinispirillales bacterium]|jgi:putative membrane protein|nr:DUF368 domain-containing protein [Chitinispirillales bacterium]